MSKKISRDAKKLRRKITLKEKMNAIGVEKLDEQQRSEREAHVIGSYVRKKTLN